MDKNASPKNRFIRFLGVFKYSAVAMSIVWDTSAMLMVTMALTTLFIGVLPAAIASVGGLFVDAVAGALGTVGDEAEAARSEALRYVFYEIGQDGATTLGQAHGGAIQKFLDENTVGLWEAHCITIYNAIGDPSLHLGGFT